MKHEIVKFSIQQTSQIVGLVSGATALVFQVPFLVLMLARGEGATGSFWFVATTPFIMAIVSYAFTALWCWVYNLIADAFGGMEFSVRVR